MKLAKSAEALPSFAQGFGGLPALIHKLTLVVLREGG